MKELVREIIDNVICIKCREVRIDPYVADPMPEKYIKLNQTAYAKVGNFKNIYFFKLLFLFLGTNHTYLFLCNFIKFALWCTIKQ